MIEDQLLNSYVEIVPDDEIYRVASHYAMQIGVFKQSETTSLRIVYDYSCK